MRNKWNYIYKYLAHSWLLVSTFQRRPEAWAVPRRGKGALGALSTLPHSLHQFLFFDIFSNLMCYENAASGQASEASSNQSATHQTFLCRNSEVAFAYSALWCMSATPRWLFCVSVPLVRFLQSTCWTHAGPQMCWWKWHVFCPQDVWLEGELLFIMPQGEQRKTGEEFIPKVMATGRTQVFGLRL